MKSNTFYRNTLKEVKGSLSDVVIEEQNLSLIFQQCKEWKKNCFILMKILRFKV